MKKDNIKLAILWVFSFFVIIFMITFTSHAQTFDNTLPFYFASIDNFNYILNETMFNTIRNGNLPLDDDDYVLILRDIGYISSTPVGNNRYYNYRFYFDLLPISSFDNYTNDIYNNTVSYTLDSDLTKYRFYVAQTYSSLSGLDYSISNTALGSVSTSFTPTGNIFGHVPTTYTAGFNSSTSPTWTFTANYPAYFNKDFLYNGDFVLFFDGSSNVPGTGHATPPNSFDDPVVNSGSNHTLPHEVPESPTINNYTWITYNPPLIDTTNLESLLESLIYVINYLAGWLRDNLAGEFQNLISNITGLINYVVETLQYYGGLIISNIQNGITTFYNNMVSLVEPIFDKVDYITSPIDSDIIYDNISTTSLVTNISTIQTSLSSFQGAFTGVNEPSSYTIPIHLENLPSNWFGNQTTQYIDLGIINGTVKDGLRLFVWAMVTYGLVVTIFDSIANYINGGGDES